jgi:hypothetical protein
MALLGLVAATLAQGCAGEPPRPDGGDVAPPVPCNGECTGICEGLCVGVCNDRNDAGTCSTACEGTCIGTCRGTCPVRGGTAGDAGGDGARNDGKLDAKGMDMRVADARGDAPAVDAPPTWPAGPPEAFGTWTNQTRVNTASWPEQNDTGAMVFDSMRGRIVMFGGWKEPSNHTWEWDTRRSTWTLMQQKDGVRPSPRTGHALAYDGRRGRVILHGGIDDSGASNNETWEWDGAAEVWTRRGAGPVPSRWGHAMAFDDSTGQVVLFGGSHRHRTLGDGELLDVWLLDPMADRWSNPTYPLPGTWPRARHGHTMAYDPSRKLVVMYGGELGNLGMVAADLWEWNSTYQAWRERTPVPTPVDWPGARSFHSLAYIGGGQMVLFGTESPSILRWIAGPNQWFNIAAPAPAIIPGMRTRALAAWDQSAGSLVAVGGQVMLGPQVLTDAWVWKP